MVTVLVLGSFLLALFDAVIIAAFVVNTIKEFLGDTPLSRLLRLLFGIAPCGLYGYWAIYKTAEFWASTDNISPLGMIIPLALPVLLIIVVWIMKGKGNNTGNAE